MKSSEYWLKEFKRRQYGSHELPDRKLKEVIDEAVKEALTERTEQCAKIADKVKNNALEAIKALPPEPNTPLIEKAEHQGWGLAATTIAHKIRALNQPENKS